MKGIIAMCLKNLVVEKFGLEKWDECLRNAGERENLNVLATSDLQDARVMKIVEAVCGTLGLTLPQAADAFGEYWVCIFSQKIYGSYYRKFQSARDFLLAMDRVHVETTSLIENARPPRFDYEWKNDKTLLMAYKSNRNLIDFVAGLAKGVGKYYGEPLSVSKIGPDRIQIFFP